MRKLLTLFTFVVLSLTPSLAQKADLFGGYQFTHLEHSYNASGWNASVTGNLGHSIGITGDFGAAYKSGTDFYTYTFGPTFTARLPVVQPFVHILVGGATLKHGDISSTGFAVIAGGGIDVGMRKGIGVRLFQADWIGTRFDEVNTSKNMRVSTGVVLKF